MGRKGTSLITNSMTAQEADVKSQEEEDRRWEYYLGELDCLGRAHAEWLSDAEAGIAANMPYIEEWDL